jgi:hypothetical protein
MGDRSIDIRAEYWNPENLGYKFLLEAKRLLEIEDKISLTTIQATCLIHVIHNINGTDKIGLIYAAKTRAMIEELELFSSSKDIKSSKMRKARTFTAWGYFNWDMYSLPVLCFVIYTQLTCTLSTV